MTTPAQEAAAGGPVLCHNVLCKIIGHKPHLFPHPYQHGTIVFNSRGVYVCLRTMRRIRNG